MNEIDFFKIAKEYTEKIVKYFLKKYGLKDAVYEALLKKASQHGLNVEYFNTLTNGAVDEVVKATKISISEIREDFTRTYMGGIKEDRQ